MSSRDGPPPPPPPPDADPDEPPDADPDAPPDADHAEPPSEADRSSLSRTSTADVSGSPRPAAAKVVSIAEPAAMQAAQGGRVAGEPADCDKSPKRFRASIGGRRRSGRPSSERSASSRQSRSEDDALAKPRPRARGRLFDLVSTWLERERARRAGQEPDPRRGSDAAALDDLAGILKQTLAAETASLRRRTSASANMPALLRHRSTASSDTDYFDSEPVVPSCEVVLDNTQTWATFQYEIVRLAHTLRLQRWRCVPLGRSSEMEVARLSGALTNAVYVVSPPAQLGHETGAPRPLLLRIYGPQVAHLIDRDAELQILRRLARKRIGPRLLGTFTNGRFEEYFHAETLTPRDLHDPATSKQIAKRMRELHQGMELLDAERARGPFVWRNWDKWVDRCERIVLWLDAQPGRGLVCGVPWPRFRATVERYRAWLAAQYGGEGSIRERLVFAHNDTQYGNILRRVLPADAEPPPAPPGNEHKRLVVIDFEYANANLPGIEFANHFTEWCYNYHDAARAFACDTARYPTPAEQHRFVCAYLQHTPAFRAALPSTPPTPALGPLPHSGSTTAFAATARPAVVGCGAGAPATETEHEAVRLMAEARLWRLANSAQWVAWGIVQASVPGLPAPAGERDADAPDADADAFDYLSYAQERARFVWGDALRLGIVRADELPDEVQRTAKVVEY